MTPVHKLAYWLKASFVRLEYEEQYSELYLTRQRFENVDRVTVSSIFRNNFP